MKAKDYFHLIAWRVTPEQRLLPDCPDTPTFMEQMQSLVKDVGVTVRAKERLKEGAERLL